MPAVVETQVEALMRANAGLVLKIAARFHAKLPPHVALADLIAAGNVGLWQAAQRFDPAAGVKFGTYAGQRVIGEIKDWLRASEEICPRMRRRLVSRGEFVPTVRQFLKCRTVFDDGREGEIDMEHLRHAAPVDTAVDDREAFDNLVRGLNRDARTVLTLYFREGCTMKEAGQAVGFCESRASQVTTAALAELRARLTVAA